MKIKWYVRDGYSGEARVHYTEVNDKDLSKCKTDYEREDLIDQRIQMDFNQKINWDRD